MLVFWFDLRIPSRLTPSDSLTAVGTAHNGVLSGTDVERRQVQVVQCRSAIGDFSVESERLGAVESGLGTLAERQGSHKRQSNGCGQSLD